MMGAAGVGNQGDLKSGEAGYRVKAEIGRQIGERGDDH